MILECQPTHISKAVLSNPQYLMNCLSARITVIIPESYPLNEVAKISPYNKSAARLSPGGINLSIIPITARETAIVLVNGIEDELLRRHSGKYGFPGDPIYSCRRENPGWRAEGVADYIK
jgi:hypothetical protein